MNSQRDNNVWTKENVLGGAEANRQVFIEDLSSLLNCPPHYPPEVQKNTILVAVCGIELSDFEVSPHDDGVLLGLFLIISAAKLFVLDACANDVPNVKVNVKASLWHWLVDLTCDVVLQVMFICVVGKQERRSARCRLIYMRLITKSKTYAYWLLPTHLFFFINTSNLEWRVRWGCGMLDPAGARARRKTHLDPLTGTLICPVPGCTGFKPPPSSLLINIVEHKEGHCDMKKVSRFKRQFVMVKSLIRRSFHF